MKPNSPASLRFSSRCGGALAFLLVAAIVLSASATASSAQVLRRGAEGGLLGAGIGALLGGKRGALRGAAIGATLGAVVGATEKDAHAYPPPPPGPYPAYDQRLVYEIQVSLTRLGYSPGPVDGQYGPRTADAIRGYEYNNQLPVTGYPSPGLHHHMVAHGG